MAVLDPNEIMFRAFEPMVQHRFVMYIDNIPAFMVKKVKVPNFTDPVIKLDHINSYRKVRGRRGYSDFYKKDLTLNILGPVGDIVGEWIIKGAFLTKGDFGDVDWTSNDGIVEIAITVAMDYCVLNY